MVDLLTEIALSGSAYKKAKNIEKKNRKLKVGIDLWEYLNHIAYWLHFKNTEKKHLHITFLWVMKTGVYKQLCAFYFRIVVRSKAIILFMTLERLVF